MIGQQVLFAPLKKGCQWPPLNGQIHPLSQACTCSSSWNSVAPQSGHSSYPGFHSTSPCHPSSLSLLLSITNKAGHGVLAFSISTTLPPSDTWQTAPRTIQYLQLLPLPTLLLYFQQNTLVICYKVHRKLNFSPHISLSTLSLNI